MKHLLTFRDGVSVTKLAVFQRCPFFRITEAQEASASYSKCEQQETRCEQICRACSRLTDSGYRVPFQRS